MREKIQDFFATQFKKMKNFCKKNKKLLKIVFLIVVLLVVLTSVFVVYQKIEKNKEFVFKTDEITFTSVKEDTFYIEFDEFTVGKYLLENNENELILVETLRGNPIEKISFNKKNKTINDKEYISIAKFDEELKINNIFNFNIIGLTKEELQKIDREFDFLQDFSYETPNGPKFGSRLVGDDGIDYFVVFYLDEKIDSVSLNLSLEKNKNFIDMLLKNKMLNKEDELLLEKNSTNSNIFYFEDGTISIKKENYDKNHIVYEIRKYNSSNIGFEQKFLTDKEFLNNK